MDLTPEERAATAQALSIYIGTRSSWIKQPEWVEANQETARRWTDEAAAAERALAKIGPLG
jgi:hypothetical protein